MSLTKFDVCSQALTLIRANAVSSFTTNSDESDICSIFYETFVKDIFSRYPWTFAKRTKTMARFASQPKHGYLYAHALPLDYERIWSVKSGGRLVEDYGITSDVLEAATIPVLLSNEENIVVEYVRRVDENIWPGYFLNYAIYAFADLIAGPITDDDATIEKMHRLAYGAPGENEKGGKFAIATSIDSQQTPSKTMDCDILIGARFA